MTDARRSTVALPLSFEAALLLLCVAAAAGMARLTTAPTSMGVLGPVVLSTAVPYAITSMCRRRVGGRVAFGAGMGSLLLVSSWLFVPGSTFLGVPTPSTLHAWAHQLDLAGTLIHSQATPLAPHHAIVLCMALGAGLAAVSARVLASWRAGKVTDITAAMAVLPPLALFCYTALLSSDKDRVQGTVGFLATLVVFGLVAERPWRGRMARRSLGVAALTVGVTLLVPLAIGPALASMRVDAVPFSTAGGLGLGIPSGSGGAGVIKALDLIDNLRAVLVDRSNQIMFSATSPQPTYWQLATLTSFDGTEWTADVATRAAAAAAQSVTGPFLPVLPAPTSGTTFDVSVQLYWLSSALLAVPPSVVSVNGNSLATLVQPVGVYRSPVPTPGFDYSATSLEPVTDISAPRDTVAASALRPYVALPRIDPLVVALAHRIVQGAPDQAVAAEDLVRFFAAQSFHYSLDAPPASSDPLATFLFVTRTGFCQQFAGAFAVLARIDGLPTRLAVGFTPGSPHGDGVQVTGADAHVWPQVYLGPSLGWVSFEPTPGSGTPAHTPGVFSARPTQSRRGPRLGSGASASPTTAPASKSASGLQTGQPATPPATRVLRALPLRPGRHATAGPSPWLWLILALTVAAGAAVLMRHRLRLAVADLRSRSAHPRASVVMSWESACRELSRRYLGRRPSETVAEHARRVARTSSAVAAPYTELARLVQAASYAPDTMTHAEAVAARALRRQVCRRAERHPGRLTTVDLRR